MEVYMLRLGNGTGSNGKGVQRISTKQKSCVGSKVLVVAFLSAVTLFLPNSASAWLIRPSEDYVDRINYPTDSMVVQLDAIGVCNDCSFVASGAGIGLYCSNFDPVLNIAEIQVNDIVPDGQDSLTGVWSATDLRNFKTLQAGFDVAPCVGEAFLYDPPVDNNACN
jgi:hypothetical protein